jgi:SAM-dependent methyltransferase
MSAVSREYDRIFIRQFVSDQVLPKLKSGMKMLDAGSGNRAEQIFREPILATGAALTTCDAKANDGVDHVVDLHALPFGDAEFDALISIQVLEHIRYPDRVCAEFFRVLKPGGIAVVTVPQITHTLTDGTPPHYFNFTRYGLETCLTDAGFKTIALEAQGGHFCVVGNMLHYSLRIIKDSTLPSLAKATLIPFCRVMFGFVGKKFFKAIDHLDTHQRSTVGWNICVTKPAAP